MASHNNIIVFTAGAAVRTGYFGHGSGGIFSVSVSNSGTVTVVSMQEEKCSHENDAALFCLGTLGFCLCSKCIRRMMEHLFHS